MSPDKKERKISYNTILKKDWKSQNEFPYKEIEGLIRYINTLKKNEKTFDLKDAKYCLLQDAKIEKTEDDKIIITGFFKSAKNLFRPNLWDRLTGEERKSPKKISEGDIEKTHFCIKITPDETFLLLEINGNGISIGHVINYFTFYTKKHLKSQKQTKAFSIFYMKIGKDDFLHEIKRLKRVRIAEILFNKSLLGSAALNFSDRTTSLKRDVVLTATAEKMESITETAIDFYNTFSNSNSVSGVRIYGKDDNNGNVILDTSFIEKVEFLKSSLNMETGEIETSDIITNMKILIKNI